MPLDPRARRFLDMIAVASASPATADIAVRRQGFRTLMQQAGLPRTDVSTADLSVPGADSPLEARIYDIAGIAATARPGMIFFHGGGFVSGDLGTHDGICSALARASGCRVLSVAYRLAPEHPMPAAIEDAWAATLGIARHASAHGIDPDRLAIGGDSVGACLAALTAQRAQRAGGPRLAAQLLICPVLDPTIHGESRAAFAQGYFLDLDTIRQDLVWCGLREADAADPRLSPLAAPDFEGLPPALIHTAEFDPVRDDGTRYAARLEQAGVPVRHRLHPGMIHLFYGFGRILPYAAAALVGMGAELGDLLGGDAAPREP